jgi:hypothetical protein
VAQLTITVLAIAWRHSQTPLLHLSVMLINDGRAGDQGVVREVRSLTPHECASPIAFYVIAHGYGRGIMSEISGT